MALRTRTMCRLLVIEYELLKFQRRHGRLPETLEDLFPMGDPVAIDPCAASADARFIYRRTDDGYELYSVGLDGVDDGGQAAEYYWVEGGDMSLDIWLDQLQ